MEKKGFLIRVDEDLLDALRKEATTRRVSQTDILKEFLLSLKQQQEIRKRYICEN